MAGNQEVTDLPVIPAVDGADVYAAKNNLDYRIRTGEAGGLATLNGSGVVTTSQLPTNVWLPLTAGVTAPLTGSLYLGAPLWNTALFNNTGGPLNQKRGGLQLRGDNGDFNLFMSNDGEAGAVIQTWSFQRSTGAFFSPGSIVGLQSFISSSASAIFATTGAGTILLRPNGNVSATGQFSLSSTGIVTTTNSIIVNGEVATYNGGFATQQILMNYGWNNNIPRWKLVIETNAEFSLYGYDSSGSTPTRMFTAYTPVAGGGISRFNIAGQVESSGGGAGYTFVDRTSGRTWVMYGTADNITFFNGAGNIAFIDPSGNVTALNFWATSDKNRKDKIEDKPARRDLASKLRLVSFIWKDSGEKDQGVIAQEIQEIAPEYVKTDADGFLSVDKVGLLLECVVDLAAQIKELKGE